MGDSFTFDPTKAADHARSLAEKDRRISGTFKSFPDGRSRWRILGPWSRSAAERSLVYKIVRKHFMKGASATVTVAKCLAQEGTDRSCPICKVVDKYTIPYDRNQSPEDRKRLDNGVWRFRANDTYNFNAILRAKAPGETDTLCILTASKDFCLWFYELFSAGIGNPLDPINGRDINVTVATKANKTKDRKFIQSDPCPMGLEEPTLQNLDALADVSDEDAHRAQEAAEALDRLMRSRVAERNAGHAAPVEPFRGLTTQINTAVDALTVDDPPSSAAVAEVRAAPRAAPAVAADGKKYPRGWRIGKSDGLPRPPKIDEGTGKPVCFGDFYSELRANDPESERATNAQCKMCPHEKACLASVQPK